MPPTARPLPYKKRPPLRMVYEDENIAALYKPGTIFRSKNPADISSHIGGMSTSHRLLILLNRIIDLTELEQDGDRGHCATPSESRFLVLDAYEYHGKTQITLLHLLDDERWRYFIDAVPAAPELEIDAIRIGHCFKWVSIDCVCSQITFGCKIFFGNYFIQWFPVEKIIATGQSAQ